MAAFSSFDQRRFGRARDGMSFAVLLTLTVASALTGAVVALVVQRFVQRYQYIDVLPQPAQPSRLQEPMGSVDTAAQASAATGPVRTAGPASRDGGEPSALAAVSSKLTVARIAELERLLVEDDVVAGDGTDTCPPEFPIKANGRSGIYHWPGALAYAQTRPTLCFRSTESADHAGFRPARR